jgi:hypothetical protein
LCVEANIFRQPASHAGSLISDIGDGVWGHCQQLTQNTLGLAGYKSETTYPQRLVAAYVCWRSSQLKLNRSLAAPDEIVLNEGRR